MDCMSISALYSKWYLMFVATAQQIAAALVSQQSVLQKAPTPTPAPTPPPISRTPTPTQPPTPTSSTSRRGSLQAGDGQLSQQATAQPGQQQTSNISFVQQGEAD